jgi:hypothetical protein
VSQKSLKLLEVENVNELLQDARTNKRSEVIDQIVEKEEKKAILEDLENNQIP